MSLADAQPVAKAESDGRAESAAARRRTGGLSLLATGGIAAWAGGVVGGLVGGMLSRGVEKEAADFYDQSLEQGDILVVAEADPQHAERLAQAERILADAGARPLPLRKQPEIE